MGDFSNLSDLIIEHETVTYKGHTLKVTGLDLASIVYIVRHHKAVLEELYTQAASGMLEGDVQAVMLDMVSKAPPLCGMIIACGMGQPSETAIASKLPVSVQIEALDKIARLTLAAEGGVGKLMEIVVGAMAGLASLTSPKA